MNGTRTATGYITIVQEQRFRITTDSGQSFLFTLAGNAPLHLSDLNRLQHAHTHVSVAYTGDPNLTSGVAHAVQPVDGWQ